VTSLLYALLTTVILAFVTLLLGGLVPGIVES
jgi:hypothetical protein